MMNKIIQVKNIIFNENEIFDNNFNKMRDDYFHIELNKLVQLLIFLNTSLKSEKINSESNNCMLIKNFKNLDKNFYELKINENQNFNLLI